MKLSVASRDSLSKFWKAINKYVRACGGSPNKKLHLDVATDIENIIYRNKDKKMNDIRLIYLRDQSKTPVGCVAYIDNEDGNFTYGASFFNSEADNVWKALARSVAEDRCLLAVNQVERRNCQGRFGSFPVTGKSLNDKVADLLTRVAACRLHGNFDVRARMVEDLLRTAANLRQRKSEAA